MKAHASSSQTDYTRDFLASVPIAVAILHLNDLEDVRTWEIATVNSKARRLIGTSITNYLNLPITELSEKPGVQALEKRYRQLIVRGNITRLGHLCGTGRHAQSDSYAITAIPMPGNMLGLLFEDNSQLKRAIKELGEARSHLIQISESARAILWRAIPHSLEFTHVSEEARDILGYWPERWLRETNFWKNRTHPEDWDEVATACSAAATGGKDQHVDCRMAHVDGHYLWFRVYVRESKTPGGKVELGGVMINITDQKRVQESARELSAAVMKAQEDERKRISRDLHDSVGQSLTGLKYGLGELERQENLPKETKTKLRESLELIENCIEEIRAVAYALHPPLLEFLGLAAALRSAAERFSQRSGIDVKLNLIDTGARLSPDVELALFRIAQECLTNVQRHSGSKRVKIRLAMDTATVFLEVADDGTGLKPEIIEQMERGELFQGIGLLKMRERVHEMKGKLRIMSNGRGTTIQVRVPRKEASAGNGEETRGNEAYYSHSA